MQLKILSMRLLTFGAVFEGLFGLYRMGWGLIVNRGTGRSVPFAIHQYNLAFYFMVFMNFAFIILLVASAHLTWRGRRSGLNLLALVLSVEIVFSLVVVLSGAGGARAILANQALVAQIWTGYPIWASVLLFFAYRSSTVIERIPSRRDPARRQKTILRVLAASALLEGGAGLCVSVVMLSAFWARNLPIRTSSHQVRLAFYSTVSFTVVLLGALFVSGILLWKLNRTGLVVIGSTLTAEVLFFTAMLAINYCGVLERTTQAASAIASSGFGVQLYTAYPVIGGVLIFIAHHSLGNSSQGER